MGSNDEAVSPATDAPTLAANGQVPTPLPPTPSAVLGWIAAAGGQAWFPSRHAAEANADRDALDEPLWQLRLAELIRVAAWVRGAGQGFVLTPAGEAAAATGVGIPGVGRAPALPAEPPPAIPDLAPEERVIRFGLDTRAPLLVPALLIANVFWFGAGLVGALRGGFSAGGYLAGNQGVPLHQFGAVSGADLLAGEWWRLASSCFVHVGLVHLCANLFALAMMGPLAELLWGRWRLAVIYAVSGLGGSCLAMALHPDGMVAGASGAIWGVLASLLAWLLLFRTHLPRDVVADWTRRLGVVLVLNAMVSLMPGVSWEAHLGGGVVGFVAAVVVNGVRSPVPIWRWVAAVLLAAVPVLSVGGLLAAMERVRPWAELRERVAGQEAQQARRAAAAEAQDRREAAAAAWRTFLRETAPKLRPEVIVPVENWVKFLLVRSADSRNPKVVAEARAELAGLKAVADRGAESLSGPPSGVEIVDQQRAKGREFAAARSRSLELLLRMLDSPNPPDGVAWAAWKEARKSADALWTALRLK